MARQLPDVDDFLEFTHEKRLPDDLEEDWVDNAIQMADDLLSLATGVEEEEKTPLRRRTVQRGVLAMAWAILVRKDDRPQEFSIFSSERIGSFAYSKMVKRIAAGEVTGVEEFDLAVSTLNSGDDANASSSVTAEDVFSRPFPGDDLDALAASRLDNMFGAAGPRMN